MTHKKRIRKYNSGNLIPMFRLAASLRNQMLEAGFTDNGGAIHSAERIINLLGLCLNYPELTHINNFQKHPRAVFSAEALLAHERGERVFIEHVSPLRDFTRSAIAELNRGATDEEFAVFVRAGFQLVLLTATETIRLNKLNRSRVEPDRLSKANIYLAMREKEPT